MGLHHVTPPHPVYWTLLRKPESQSGVGIGKHMASAATSITQRKWWGGPGPFDGASPAPGPGSAHPNSFLFRRAWHLYASPLPTCRSAAPVPKQTPRFHHPWRFFVLDGDVDRYERGASRKVDCVILHHPFGAASRGKACDDLNACQAREMSTFLVLDGAPQSWWQVYAVPTC